MAEKFCLKWNDFQSTVSQSFSSLRKEKDFFDVTLVSDDEVQISAHKVVLSACSSFFKSILKTNNHPQPLIYLSGVSSMNLGFVLDYMYQGELDIYQNHLDAFLDTAQKLKISGLLANDSSFKNENKVMEDFSSEETLDDQEPLAESLNEESSPYLNSRLDFQVKSHPIAKFSLATNDKSDINSKVEEILTQNDRLLTCSVCGKTGTDKGNMKRHAETHIDGMTYPCELCGKTFRSSNAFHKHTYRHRHNLL